jgi:hypothetical protein
MQCRFSQPICNPVDLPDVPTSEGFDSGNTVAIGLDDGAFNAST